MKIHLLWLLICLSSVAITLQFRRDRISIVEKPVVVTKEIEKIVEVPAKIPDNYVVALSFMKSFTGCEFVSLDGSLAGVDTVSVRISLSEDVKKIVTDSEIRTKFEITLRKAGVPIDEKSLYVLNYSQDGFTRNAPHLTYLLTTHLDNLAYSFRKDSKVISALLTSWNRESYGSVGVLNAKQALISNAESAAEEFANEWLARNPQLKTTR